MKQDYVRCPRCNGEWGSISSVRWRCDVCGLDKGSYNGPQGFMYLLNVGDSTIHWFFDDECDDLCMVYYNGASGVKIDGPLPFDVSEDALRVFMVFQ